MLIHFLTTLVQLLGSGVGVWAVTEGVKRIPQIPINEGQTTALRSTAGVLSAVAVLLLGFANKDLQPTDAINALQAILGVVITWATAHSIHKANS